MTCHGDFLPHGMSAELCQECIRQREKLIKLGDSPRAIGLLLCGTWRDATPLAVTFRSGKSIRVEIKYLCDGENAGIVRLRFDKRPKWLASGVFGDSAIRAISEARHFLREFYFPREQIAFP